MYSAWLRVRLLYTIVRCRLCKFFIDVFPGVWRWQDCALMRSRALADGKMPAKCVPPASDGDKVLARCVPERFAVARFRRGAFPGGNPGQVLRSMHPERGLGRENRQFVARFARHASENGLALAGCARHVSEKPRKPPSEDTPREDLARKGPFSLHGSLESCIVSRSCHPPRRRTAPAPATLPPSNRPSGRSPLRCRTARAIATTAPPLWRGSLPRGGRTGRGRLLVERGDVAKGVRGVVGCRALAAKLASVKLRLQVSDADNLAES